jgi:hypothetical protein
MTLTEPQRRHLRELAEIAARSGEAFWVPVGSGEMQTARVLRQRGYLEYVAQRTYELTEAGKAAAR